jgi:hypothetical protein
MHTSAVPPNARGRAGLISRANARAICSLVASGFSPKVS